MKLALIFPPFHYKTHEENFKLLMDNFGRYPPMSILYTAAIAEESGHEVTVIDANANMFSKQKVIAKLSAFNPDILGFMVTTYMFQETLEWIKHLKAKLNKPVIIGGFNMLIYPEESLSHSEIDYGIIGSAKQALPALLSALTEGRELKNIEGLCYKDTSGTIKMNKPDRLFYPLETLPFPARHLVDNSKYYAITSQRKNFTVLFTSRGCPMPCNFCEEGKTPFVGSPALRVADEIQQCYTEYDIREFEIFDIAFTHDRQRVLDICSEIIKRKLRVYWAVRARVDSLDDGLLRSMRQAGCERIYFGIESGSQRILNNLKKGIEISRIKETVRLTQKNNIRPLGFFMLGNPGENIQDIKETIRFAKTIGLDYAQFGKTTAKPATFLNNLLIQQTNTDYWKEYVSGQAVPRELERPWTDLTKEEVNYWTRRAYREFYLSPRYLIKALLRIKSFPEFLRNFKTFIELLKGKSCKI